MLRSFAENWWVFLLQGTVAILFGLGALAWPGLTLLVLITFFGASALVDGLLALIGMFRTSGTGTPRWLFLLRGLVGIGAGIATFAWPGLTALLLVYLIAARALVAGVFEIVGAIALRKEIEGEWLLVASGVLSVLFGLVLFAAPGEGAMAIISVIGIFAVAIGIMLVLAAFRLRGLRDRLDRRGEPRPV